MEKLLTVCGAIDLSALTDAAEEDFLDAIGDVIFGDCDNPYGVNCQLKRGKYLLDGWLTESAYERLEDLMCDFGVKFA